MHCVPGKWKESPARSPFVCARDITATHGVTREWHHHQHEIAHNADFGPLEPRTSSSAIVNKTEILERHN